MCEREKELAQRTLPQEERACRWSCSGGEELEATKEIVAEDRL